jgi:cytochrome c oxidase cbb3-type subunit 3
LKASRRWFRSLACLALAGTAATLVLAQAPGPGPASAAPGPGAQGPPAAGRGGGRGPAPFPARPPADPAVVDHGKQLFASNCSFCHGSDARGGETGPNLVRSQIVLDDVQGEAIGQVVLNGRPEKGMPKFDMAATDIIAIAAYLHSLMAMGRGAPSANINVLVGDAKAGEAYFNGPGKCNTCHSVTGDLAGVGGKYEPKTLQNLIVSGGGGGRGFGAPGAGGGAPAPAIPPTTVTVTLASGQKVEGKLDQMDAFEVKLTDASGARHTIAVDNGAKVDVHNPLQPHIDMLPHWNDTDIHNLTAYLAGQK